MNNRVWRQDRDPNCERGSAANGTYPTTQAATHERQTLNLGGVAGGEQFGEQPAQKQQRHKNQSAKDGCDNRLSS